MNIFICPVCGEKLNDTGKSYVCGKNHSFDIARSGYVNLLLSKHAGKTVHGDNKLMVQARKNFLDKGYYSKLKDELCEAVRRYSRKGSMILDAGCGEGYYTAAVAEAVPGAGIYGIDISKTAVEYAAKRCKTASFATASVFHIPAEERSCDMLITLFAPYCGEEFRRVLRDGGIMIMAIPSENHLWELKQAIYDTPYKNEVKPYELDGFALIRKKRISYRIQLDSQEDIQSLFSMTPYYYKTGKAEQQRLAALENLETQVDFELLIYKKV
ncbi:MAG: methyltransferase domain-containing protein [Ruminococcus sp.]|nr:methyltransferase domain-containing protein [Ruminococcus sp.]